MEKKTRKRALLIYQSRSGAIEFRGDWKKETIWATQAQIVELFGVDQSVISRHIRNVFEDGEIEKKSNMQKMHIAKSDKPVVLYSLDVILSVGYRTNSKVAIEFRKWATKTLREYITKGYAINKKRVVRNYQNFMEAVARVRSLLPSHATVDAKDILELISLFADTWVSLHAYDKKEFPIKKTTKKKIIVTARMLMSGVALLKNNLIQKGETTDFFGTERERGSVEGIIGNIMQSFGGNEVYASIEEKAAHLLYFMVKNHPFVDGNKRIGAYTFIWFLRTAGILNISRITPEALTALTLFIAESNSKNKEDMVRLIVMVISGEKI